MDRDFLQSEGWDWQSGPKELMNMQKILFVPFNLKASKVAVFFPLAVLTAKKDSPAYLIHTVTGGLFPC